MVIDIQLFGGRGGGPGMGGGGPRGSTANQSDAVGSRIPGGPVSGDFIQTADGRWESERRVITAVGGNARVMDSQFEIVEGEYKGRTVYRAYQNMLNHREFLFRSNSVEDAARRINRR